MTGSVVVTFALEPELVARVAAVDPTLDVRVLGREPAEALRDRRRFPSELQAVTPAAEIVAALRDAEVLFAYWGGELPRLLPSAEAARALAPGLRWVQLTHAGADQIGRSLLGSGIRFTTASGLAAVPIAEFALAYMLLFTKGWPALFRNQQDRRYARFVPGELAGRTVGVVGMGHIGREVARLAKAFGCRVLAIRRSYRERGADPPADEALPPADLDYLLRESDFVVLAAPLSDETAGLIGERELRLIGPRGYLINVARGGLVDEPALVRALSGGAVAGAALDVFEHEPLPAESALWALENVILTPHIAAGTEHYEERATEIFCANLRRYVAGEPLEQLVSDG